jgi:hypothetical protein
MFIPTITQQLGTKIYNHIASNPHVVAYFPYLVGRTENKNKKMNKNKHRNKNKELIMSSMCNCS